MNVVSTWPSMKAEWLKISRCSGIVVLMPSTTNSASARRMQASASGRDRLVDEQLGQQRIVVRRHAVAGDDVGVEAHAGAAGHLPARDQAGRGAEVGGGVFGVDAALDGRALVDDVGLVETQRLAGGDADLLLHQVDARDQFGDGMLDLDAGIDFDEVEAMIACPPGIRRCRRSGSSPL